MRRQRVKVGQEETGSEGGTGRCRNEGGKRGKTELSTDKKR